MREELIKCDRCKQDIRPPVAHQAVRGLMANMAQADKDRTKPVEH